MTDAGENPFLQMCAVPANENEGLDFDSAVTIHSELMALCTILLRIDPVFLGKIAAGHDPFADVPLELFFDAECYRVAPVDKKHFFHQIAREALALRQHVAEVLHVR